MTPPDPDVALVLLAAGRGERFGGDKLTAPFRGRPLWEWAALAAEDAGFTARYVVVAEGSTLGDREGWVRVVNPRAGEGMGTSIGAGVAAAAAHRRVVIALADMPDVPAAHLRRLGEAIGTVFTRQRDGSAGSPAGFASDSFAQLRSLTGERGARSLALPDAMILEAPDEAALFDVDRRADLR